MDGVEDELGEGLASELLEKDDVRSGLETEIELDLVAVERVDVLVLNVTLLLEETELDLAGTGAAGRP